MKVRLPQRGAVLFSLVVAGAAAAGAQSTGIAGIWRGTSTCIDRERYPACRDEEVIYDARARNNSADSVNVRADKLVNGAREFMAAFDFIRQAEGSWTADIRTPRFHMSMKLHVVGNSMTGTLSELPSNRTIRKVALDRAPLFASGSPIEELARRFRSGRPPTSADLVGKWVGKQHIVTQAYVNGKAGPDRVFPDSSTLLFAETAGHTLSALFSRVHSTTSAAFDARGEFSFLADDAADVAIIYTCRLAALDQLICFDLAHTGDGAEFVKQR